MSHLRIEPLLQILRFVYLLGGPVRVLRRCSDLGSSSSHFTLAGRFIKGGSGVIISLRHIQPVEPLRHHRQAGSDNQVPCVYIRINPCTHTQNVSRLRCGAADVLVLRLQPKPVRARVFSVQPSRATDEVSDCLQRL